MLSAYVRVPRYQRGILYVDFINGLPRPVFTLKPHPAKLQLRALKAVINVKGDVPPGEEHKHPGEKRTDGEERKQSRLIAKEEEQKRKQDNAKRRTDIHRPKNSSESLRFAQQRHGRAPHPSKKRSTVLPRI